jgi:predicted transcriptional regulator
MASVTIASVTIRSAYALDRETVSRLDNLARQWNVSKSEALRRAIRAADRLSNAFVDYFCLC